jgi:hypothetical protein
MKYSAQLASKRQLGWGICLSLPILLAGISRSLLAQENAPTSQQDAQQRSQKLLLGQAQRMIVKVGAESEQRTCELNETPLIHYSDQVRQLPESSLWVWHLDGRPTLFCKVERIVDDQGATKSWQYCCVPATDQKADVEWDREFRWRARNFPFKWSSLPSEPGPRPQAAGRLSQMKAIARQFEGETEQTNIQSKQTLRLLATPLHRFDSAKSNVLDGAVFGLASNGTNPDALLIIEALAEEMADARWRYAIVGMTGDAVTIRRHHKTVYTKDFSGSPGDHRSWMWYTAVPRH